MLNTYLAVGTVLHALAGGALITEFWLRSRTKAALLFGVSHVVFAFGYFLVWQQLGPGEDHVRAGFFLFCIAVPVVISYVAGASALNPTADVSLGWQVERALIAIVSAALVGFFVSFSLLSPFQAFLLAGAICNGLAGALLFPNKKTRILGALMLLWMAMLFVLMANPLEMSDGLLLSAIVLDALTLGILVRQLISPTKSILGSAMRKPLLPCLAGPRVKPAALSRESMVLDQVPCALVEWGKDGRIVFWNAKAAILFGRDAGQMIGTEGIDLMVGIADYEESWFAVEKLLASPGHNVSTFQACHSNGQFILARCRLTTIVDEYGQISGVAAIIEDISAEAEAELRLHQLAYIDPLTQLPNRSSIKDAFEERIAKLKSADLVPVMVVVDIDKFRGINTLFGHRVADDLIAKIAERLRLCLFDRDRIYRIAVDRFLMICGVRDGDEDAKHLVDKVKDQFEQPTRLGASTTAVTACIGVWRIDDASVSFEEAITKVEFALTDAKRRGRGSVVYFDKEMHQAKIRKMGLEHALVEAVDRGELRVQYQPQYNLETSEIIGAEALVRWRHNDHEISPMEFIPIAEETGLIHELGQFVLLQAINCAKAWSDRVGKPFKVAVNVSAKQILEPEFPNILQSLLSDTGIRPELLELELTETGLIEESVLILDTLRAVRDMGVTIAIDDFGTGYSSLSYLHRFPINKLKIDRAFVNDIRAGQDEKPLASAIIGIAQNLNMQVIAEGVETDYQASQLRNMGCSLIQGFLISRPVDKDQFDTLLASRSCVLAD